jgi:hypothetical protein
MNSGRVTTNLAEELLEAAEANDGTGFCIACGERSEGVEPDAREYECEACGASKVYGAEELVIMGHLI